MYNNFLKKCARLKSTLLNKEAVVQSSELTVLLIVAVIVSFAVVAIIVAKMGDGESEENGGILKGAKNRFDRAQT